MRTEAVSITETILQDWKSKRGVLNYLSHRQRIAQVLELYANGEQIPAIAYSLCINQSTVCEYIKKHYTNFVGANRMVIKLTSKV